MAESAAAKKNEAATAPTDGKTDKSNLTTAPKTGDEATDNTTKAVQETVDEAEEKGYLGEVPPPAEPVTS
jgi:hypothetical protein